MAQEGAPVLFVKSAGSGEKHLGEPNHRSPHVEVGGARRVRCTVWAGLRYVPTMLAKGTPIVSNAPSSGEFKGEAHTFPLPTPRSPKKNYRGLRTRSKRGYGGLLETNY